MNKNIYFNDIIWGNRLFVNAQFVIRFVNVLTKYSHGKIELQTVFDYANAIKNQKKVVLYEELDREVEEICLLEKTIKEGEITLNDTNIINFIICSQVLTFTKDWVFKKDRKSVV